MKKFGTRLLAVVVASSMIAMPVMAAPSVDDLKEDKAAKESEVKSLQDELNSIMTKLGDLEEDLISKGEEISQAEKDLEAAEEKEQEQYEAMKKRIKFMYETGNPSFLDMICKSENMADFLNRTEFVKNVTEYDRNMLEELKDIRSDIEEKESALNDEQAKLLSMQETLKTKSSELNAKISSTSSDLQASAEALANAKAAQDAASSSSGNSDSAKPAPPSNGASTNDLVLFAGILQCEAGTSNYDALLAVATVIMNRVESPNYPNSLYGVIYQRGQFSPTWNGSLSRVLAKGPASLCYQAAQDALNGSRLASVRNCFFFNATWTGKQGIIVGGNVFW